MANLRIAGTVVALSLSTLAVAVPAEAARTAPKVHTIKFDVDTLREKDIKTTTLGADTDVVGKSTVGYDVSRAVPSGNGGAADLVFALQSGGLIYAHVIENLATLKVEGTVTGGTGTYVAAKGTITVTNSSKVAHVVIKWHK